MKATLNVIAKTSWTSAGHSDQTVDMPCHLGIHNRQYRELFHCWDNLPNSKKAISKISGTEFMKDRKNSPDY